MRFIADALVIGLTEHAHLVLAAMGFALLYRLTGLINVAYSETVTLGAYFGVWVNTTFGLNFYLSLIPAGLLAGLMSVVTYLAIFRPAKQRNVGVLELIIISFGLSIFLRYGLQFVFGYVVRFYEVPPPDTIFVLGVGVASFRLLAVASVALLALLLYWFIQHTQFGLQILAGGLAGAFYGVGSSVRPWLGWEEFLFILLVALVAGSRNIRGVIIAGIGAGVALAAMTLQFGQVLYAKLALIIIFMIILKLRGNRLAEAGKV
jgi:branched-subunit amino acid ABC-type transport system permease component